MDNVELVELEILFSIQDVKSKIWSTPIAFRTEDAFKSYLSYLVNTKGEGHYHKYPDDFIAFELGTFNSETGQIAVLDTPVPMYALSALMEKENVTE